jgi:two-component system, NtrC family, sensor kinase
MPGESGLGLLKFAAEHYPATGRIMMTGFNTMETAKEVLKVGVYGYLLKPLEKELVRITVQNCLRHMLLENQMKACLAEAQKEVMNINLMLETILNNIDVGVVLIDPEMRMLKWNSTMELLFPQIQGKKGTHCFELIPEHPRSALCDECSTVKAFEMKRPMHTERIISTKDGLKELRISSLPIIEHDKSIKKGMILYYDITEIMEGQRAVSESNKLVAVGQLASGIAHEINTPVQFVGDNIGYLRDTFGNLQPLFSLTKEIQESGCDDQTSLHERCLRLQEVAEAADLDFILQDIPDAIAQSLEGVKRISDIVKAMKDFAHPGEQEKTLADLNGLIQATLTVCKNEWKYVAEITLNLDSDLPQVECLSSEISQVILVLVVNAAHSIEEKIADGTCKMGKIHIATKRYEENRVQIVIQDTGKGIPAEIQEKIFQAFFTTKKRGKGTGQGLTMARNIITEKHNGQLLFTSEPGNGTEFSIILPVISQ